MESHHGKSKGDAGDGLLKMQLDKSIYIENKFHHNTKQVFDYCKEKLSYNHEKDFGIREVGCVCQSCRMFRFYTCNKPYVKYQLK